MTRRRLSKLGARGAAAVEFGIVASIFMPLCLAVIEIGMLVWANGALQSVAAEVARCTAIASPNCPNAGNYAVTLAGSWVFPGIITASNVTSTASVCVSHALFQKVVITSSYWGSSLPNPFVAGKYLSGTLTATAYFPSSASSC